MLTIKSQPYNSVWVSADSQDELGLTFMRFQEHYESDNPKFRNNIFTFGQLRHWYSETYGANNYQSTWIGFNFPSRVLIPFKEGLFDPLTPEENRLLELLRYRKEEFYIIGAQNNSVLRHELSHALYASNPKYKAEIDNFLYKHKSKLTKTNQYILNKGYCKDVLNDEIQAYITDNDDSELINITSPTIIAGINQIFNKYNKAKVKK
ncbi:MAG: hypothetical protein ACK55I_30175 [bacterium]